MDKSFSFTVVGDGVYKVFDSDRRFLEPIAKTLSSFSGRKIHVTEVDRGYCIYMDEDLLSQCFIVLHNLCLHSDDGITC